MKIKKIGLTARMLVVISLFMILFVSVQGYILVTQSKEGMKTQIRERMQDISNTAAAMMDGDAIASLRPGDEGSAPYREVMDVLALFRDHIDLEYIYVVRDEGNKNFTFIIDSDVIAPAYFGETVKYTDALYQASLGTTAVDNEPYQDRWGRFYSSYSPIFDSYGQVAGIVGVDFAAKWYDEQVSMHMQTVLIFDVIAIAVGLVLILFVGGKTAKNFQTLGSELNELEEDVETLTQEVAHSLGIDSQGEEKETNKAAVDDVGELGDKIGVMQRDLRKYIDYMRSQAYSDVMTGIGNKSAYLDAADNLERALGGTVNTFSIAVFDINGLKNLNDTLGHECGDFLIIDAANALKRVFGEERIYRIGGDEFVALLEGVTFDEVSKQLAALDDDLAAFNAGKKRYGPPLALSKGAAEYLSKQDKGCTDVFRRADEAMYADKAAYYRTHADRRRATT